jgi:hypothetical protein
MHSPGGGGFATCPSTAPVNTTTSSRELTGCFGVSISIMGSSRAAAQGPKHARGALLHLCIGSGKEYNLGSKDRA